MFTFKRCDKFKLKCTSRWGMYSAHYFGKLSTPLLSFIISHFIHCFYQFQSFLFTVVIVISILLNTTFWQISIHSQLLVKILERSDKEKATFKAIEKYRYGVWKTVSKHLKSLILVYWREMLRFDYIVSGQVQSSLLSNLKKDYFERKIIK